MSKDAVKSDYIFDEASDEEANRFDIDPYMINFLTHEPFFSSILRSLHRVKTSDIPTAGVTAVNGRITLYWNPKFLASLPSDHIIGLMKHECYHLIFKHCTARKQTPHQMWNIATDLAINSIIPTRQLPSGGLIPGQALKDMGKIKDPIQKDAWQKLSNLIASFPRNQTSEWYMKKLMEDKDLQEAMDKLPKEYVIGGMDDHDGWDQLSDEERELVEGQIKDIVGKAAKDADKNNAWGSVSSDVRRKIRKLFSNSVDWKKVLQSFVGRRQRANRTSTHRRLNRKYPYIHPGRKIGHTSNLAVYIDQSGSIGDDDIAAFTGVLTGLAKSATFTFYNFDTRVDEKSKKVWKKGKKNIEIERTVAGGTCFQSVENHFKDSANDYDGYIVLTDGCAGKPTPCIKRRCWVVLPEYKLMFNHDNTDVVVNMTK